MDFQGNLSTGQARAAKRDGRNLTRKFWSILQVPAKGEKHRRLESLPSRALSSLSMELLPKMPAQEGDAARPHAQCDTQHGDLPPWGTPSALLLRAGRGQGPPPRPCCPQPCPSGPWTGGCSALLTPSDFCSFSCHQLPPWEGKKHLPVPPEAEPRSPRGENPLQQEHLSL